MELFFLSLFFQVPIDSSLPFLENFTSVYWSLTASQKYLNQHLVLYNLLGAVYAHSVKIHFRQFSYYFPFNYKKLVWSYNQFIWHTWNISTNTSAILLYRFRTSQLTYLSTRYFFFLFNILLFQLLLSVCVNIFGLVVNWHTCVPPVAIIPTIFTFPRLFLRLKHLFPIFTQFRMSLYIIFTCIVCAFIISIVIIVISRIPIRVTLHYFFLIVVHVTCFFSFLLISIWESISPSSVQYSFWKWHQNFRLLLSLISDSLFAAQNQLVKLKSLSILVNEPLLYSFGQNS